MKEKRKKKEALLINMTVDCDRILMIEIWDAAILRSLINEEWMIVMGRFESFISSNHAMGPINYELARWWVSLYGD